MKQKFLINKKKNQENQTLWKLKKNLSNFIFKIIMNISDKKVINPFGDFSEIKKVTPNDSFISYS